MIINPYIFGAAFTGLLDTYSGASAAYSLRKLRSAYSGNCIRVRRSSDNTEQNIGFVNNVLDETSLTSFVGAGDGFVTTWYDQSGNSKDITNSIGTGQPRIVSSGVIDKTLGKPTIYFGYNTATPRLSALENASMGMNNAEVTTLSVANKLASTGSNYTYSRIYSLRSTGNDYDNANSLTSFLAQASFGGFNPALGTYSQAAGVFLSYTYNNTILSWSQKSNTGTAKLYIAKNGGATSNSNTGGGNITATKLTLGGNNVGDSYLNGYISEFILYPLDQTSNKTGIETNINTYYSIY